MGMDLRTGELTEFKPGDPRITNPPENMVVLYGRNKDVEAISKAYKAELKAKAKRKAQKAARKRNR